MKEPLKPYYRLHEDTAYSNIGKERGWLHSQPKIRHIHSNPAFHDYDIEKVSIDDLIRDNDLDNPVALSNHAEIWSPTGNEEDIHPEQFKYLSDKDQDPTDIIYGTRKLDGSIKLSNGRHRIRALKNSGYTHVAIPVHEALMDTNGALNADYYSGQIKPLRVWLKYLPYSEFSPDQQRLIQNKIKGKIKYLEYLDRIKNNK